MNQCVFCTKQAVNFLRHQVPDDRQNVCKAFCDFHHSLFYKMSNRGLEQATAVQITEDEYEVVRVMIQ
jgi:hypothetical protein